MRLRPLSPLFFLSLFAIAIAGCPTGTGGDDGGTMGDGDGDGDGDVPGDCPEGGGTVCDVQNSDSANYVAENETATLTGVVATTATFSVSMNLDGFFVADDPNAYYSGVLVTVPAGSTPVVSRGDTLDITAVVTEFGSMTSAGSETQLAVFPDDGGSYAVTGTGSVNPIDVSNLNTINSEAAEGVLVRISDVFVSNADAGGGRFEVQNVNGDTVRIAPYIQDGLYSAADGEVLTTVVGVVRYSTFEAGSFELAPRDADDVASEGLSFPTKTIEQMRNPDATDYTPECDFDDDDCPIFLYENLVVTSPTLVASDDDETGDPIAFGFYVADPLNVNGDGELEPYSGTFVNAFVVGNGLRENSYSFGRNSDGAPFGDPTEPGANPADFPQIGDVVSIAGASKPYFGLAQLSDLVILRKEGTVDTLGDVTMPFPAQFDDATAGELRGGRPNNSVGPVDDFNVTPAADIEQWEAVLVQLNGVQTTDACYPSPYNPGGFTSDPSDAFLSDFGYFLVTGDVEIGTQFNPYLDTPFGGYWSGLMFDDPARNCDNTAAKCADSRELGQTFTSLTGVVNFSFDVHRVNPRSAADFQPNTLFAADTCN